MSNNYRFTEEKDPAEKIPLPKRISILIDAYLDAGKKIDKNLRMHYDLETADNREIIFEQKLRMNPNSLKILISAIYKVKHDNVEYYLYNMTRRCKNKLNNPKYFPMMVMGIMPHQKSLCAGTRLRKSLNRPSPVMNMDSNLFLTRLRLKK